MSYQNVNTFDTMMLHDEVRYQDIVQSWSKG